MLPLRRESLMSAVVPRAFIEAEHCCEQTDQEETANSLEDTHKCLSGNGRCYGRTLATKSHLQ